VLIRRQERMHEARRAERETSGRKIGVRMAAGRLVDAVEGSYATPVHYYLAKIVSTPSFVSDHLSVLGYTTYLY
jgi:hypothetical protein